MFVFLFVFCFFFSSRRRHTRLQGDWSSDVCSSDLKKSNRPALAENLRPNLAFIDSSDRKGICPIPRARARPSLGLCLYSPLRQVGSLKIAHRAIAFREMAWGEGRGVVAKTIAEAMLSGYWVAHSRACMPPMLPPMTQSRRWIPRDSISSFWALTMSR